MKKINLMSVLLVIMLSMLVLSACGAKKCTECGKTVTKGYQAFGNTYCENCFW